jgi:hypothetical protein
MASTRAFGSRRFGSKPDERALAEYISMFDCPDKALVKKATADMV